MVRAGWAICLRARADRVVRMGTGSSAPSAVGTAAAAMLKPDSRFAPSRRATTRTVRLASSSSTRETTRKSSILLHRKLAATRSKSFSQDPAGLSALVESVTHVLISAALPEAQGTRPDHLDHDFDLRPALGGER